MASALHWIPDSLYNSAISAVVASYSTYMKDVRTFPENVLFDVYYKLYKEGRLCQLASEFNNLDIFDRLLKVQDKRYLLHNAFQAVMDHGSHTASDLAAIYVIHCNVVKNSTTFSKNRAIQLGLSLSGFLSDAGWFLQSEKIMTSCLALCKTVETEQYWITCMECYIRLLHVRNLYSKLPEAEETLKEAQEFINCMKSKGQNVNLAAIYGEFSTFFVYRSNYKEAYHWSIKALQELNSCLSLKVIVDVLRQASKACVVRRQFKQAGVLIEQAMYLTREHFGNRHPIMADALIEYGFYLLNVDNIWHSVKVYQAALDTRMSIFGGKNLLVAIAHEDLAYASYVYEYSSGRFKDAREHAEKAIKIMNSLLKEDHLLLASSKRIKALILEEIAIDNDDTTIKENLLAEAQELHLSALQLVKKTFGEMNLHIAKHYGNLGRLYQSMKRYQEAEEMHLKAISIKEELMGSDDYEIAISLDHLASLYNYDLMRYDKAEELYIRAINIGLELFGKDYSGLEFEYRGLLRVYTNIGNMEGAQRVQMVFNEWKVLRDRAAEEKQDISPLNINLVPIAVEDVYAFISAM